MLYFSVMHSAKRRYNGISKPELGTKRANSAKTMKLLRLIKPRTKHIFVGFLAHDLYTAYNIRVKFENQTSDIKKFIIDQSWKLNMLFKR